MRPRLLILQILFCLGWFVSGATHADTHYTFYITDNEKNALADVVIEPDVGSVSQTPTEVAVIDQIDKQFKPKQIVVEKGQSVNFPNSDNIRHHVYSFSKAKIFELKLYADTPEAPIQFPDHGVVVLGCNIHDSMIGYIFVSKSTETVSTTENGEATLRVKDAIDHINVWHAHNAAGPESLLRVELESLTQDASGRYLINIDILEPAPRNSFEDTFGGISQEY